MYGFINWDKEIKVKCNEEINSIVIYEREDKT